MKGKPDEGLVEAREAVRLDPNNGWAHQRLAWTLNLLGKSDEALAEAREAVRLEPGNAEYHAQIAWALSERATTMALWRNVGRHCA
ncbi:MAG: tetratricopeptide repeat protein [Acidobacteriia bacterium]|nr:tetratricopeptide repeat protein [Terriglobia bacterium]